MQSSQSIKVYCPDIQCGYESVTAAGAVPIRSRHHRRMNYVGRRRVGIAFRAVLNVLDPGNPAEIGTYHLYSCPVCGREATYHERWGVIRRVE